MKFQNMSKKKNKKGSALVVSLLVLMIILISALSISLVYIRERKASIANSKSNQAIQNLMTNIEEVKNDIIRNNRRLVSEIGTGEPMLSCNAGIIEVGSSAVGRVELLDQSKSPFVNGCNNPTALVSEIGYLHSYGRSGQTERDFTVPMQVSITKLLMHFDDDSGNLSIEDYSMDFNVTTNSGVPVVLDSDEAFGTQGAASFPANSYIKVESSYPSNENDFNFLDQDFTIDTWVKIDPTAITPAIVSQWGNDKQFRFYYDNRAGEKRLVLDYYDGSDNDLKSSGGLILENGSWHHVAVERKDGTVYFFVGGVLRDGSDGNIGNDGIDSRIGEDLYIGASFDDPAFDHNFQFIGSMDELRITKGMARFDTGGFAGNLWSSEYSPSQ